MRDLPQPHLIWVCPESQGVVGALQGGYVVRGGDGGRVPRTWVVLGPRWHVCRDPTPHLERQPTAAHSTHKKRNSNYIKRYLAFLSCMTWTNTFLSVHFLLSFLYQKLLLVIKRKKRDNYCKNLSHKYVKYLFIHHVNSWESNHKKINKELVPAEDKKERKHTRTLSPRRRSTAHLAHKRFFWDL